MDMGTGMARKRKSSQTGARFQQQPLRSMAGALLLGATLLPPQLVQAQDVQDGAASLKPAWQVTTRLSLKETFTDNVQASASGNRHSDQISEIAPGITVIGQSARLKGHLDYQLRGLAYAQDSRRNKAQHDLSAAGNLEVVDGRVFVDASALATQQDVSLLGTRSGDNYWSDNANLTQTASFNVSPYMRGHVGRMADYELRYQKSLTRNRALQARDIDHDNYSLSLQGARDGRLLSWSATATRQTTEYSGQRKTEADQLRAFLTLHPDQQWDVSLIGGRERNDYLSFNKEGKTTAGVALNWSPSMRTRLSLLKESRFFGTGHNFSLTHRARLLAFNYADVRDVKTFPEQYQLGFVNAFDLFDKLLTGTVPDAEVRAQQINQLLPQLGLSPYTPMAVGALSSQVTVDRDQTLSLGAYGARNAVALLLRQSKRQALGVANQLFDDFALSPSITQRDATLSWSYRLSPDTALSVNVTQTQALAQSAAQYDNRQRKYQLGLNGRIGARTTAAVEWRRTLFKSAAAPYDENVLIGSLNFQF